MLGSFVLDVGESISSMTKSIGHGIGLNYFKPKSNKVCSYVPPPPQKIMFGLINKYGLV
jgi:hypothetical protein